MGAPQIESDATGRKCWNDPLICPGTASPFSAAVTAPQEVHPRTYSTFARRTEVPNSSLPMFSLVATLPAICATNKSPNPDQIQSRSRRTNPAQPKNAAKGVCPPATSLTRATSRWAAIRWPAAKRRLPHRGAPTLVRDLGAAPGWRARSGQPHLHRDGTRARRPRP